MGRVLPPRELFKLYSESDQQEYLGEQQAEIDSLQSEANSYDFQAQKKQDLSDQSLDNTSGYYSLSEYKKGNGFVPKNDNLALAIIGEMNKANAGPGGMDQSVNDDLNDIVYLTMSQKYEEESKEYAQKRDEINDKVGEKQQYYDDLVRAKDEPQDVDALNADLDYLYKAQQQNYQDYLANQEKVERKKHQIESTKSIIFARHGKMKEELEALEEVSDQIVSDFIANDDIVRKAAEFLTPEELSRFDELFDKMAAAMRKAKNLPDPAEPPKPPEPIAPTPIGNFFAKAGDKMVCPFAMGGTAALVVNPSRRVFLEGKPMANIMDFQPGSNITTFGVCMTLTNPAVAAATSAALGVLTPQPCLPVITAPWAPGKPDLLVEGAPALLVTDKTMCAWGGVISFIPV